jgi:hypothetical protein
VRHDALLAYEAGPGMSQADATLAFYRCAVQYPDVPIRDVVPTPENHRFQYNHIVETQIPCLRNLGFTIADPPTFQTDLETITTEGYNPLDEAGQQAGDDEARYWTAWSSCSSASDEEIAAWRALVQ